MAAEVPVVADGIKVTSLFCDRKDGVGQAGGTLHAQGR